MARAKDRSRASIGRRSRSRRSLSTPQYCHSISPSGFQRRPTSRRLCAHPSHCSQQLQTPEGRPAKLLARPRVLPDRLGLLHQGGLAQRQFTRPDDVMQMSLFQLPQRGVVAVKRVGQDQRLAVQLERPQHGLIDLGQQRLHAAVLAFTHAGQTLRRQDRADEHRAPHQPTALLADVFGGLAGGAALQQRAVGKNWHEAFEQQRGPGHLFQRAPGQDGQERVPASAWGPVRPGA